MIVLNQILEILPGARSLRNTFAIAFAIFLSGTAGLSCGLPGQDPGVPRTTQDERLRVGTSGDYPPFSDWPSAASEPEGFSIDVATAFARARGRRIEWVRFAWPDLLRDLEHERFDLALSGVTVRPDRSAAGRFSLPLTTSGAVVLVETSSALRSDEDLDRPGLAMAVNAGGHLERVARRLFPEAALEAVAGNERVLERLGPGGVDALVTDTLEAPLWQARRPGLRAIGPLTSDRKAAWFHEDLALGELRAFDEWLLRAETNGQLAGLRARHGLPATATALPLEALLAGLDERLSLMVDVARCKRSLAMAVEDRAREARVLDAATREISLAAARNGAGTVDLEAVRRFYAAQIEAAKWIQRSWLDSQPLASPPPDEKARRTARIELDDRLRPALLSLGDRIARLLVLAIDDRRLSTLSVGALEVALGRHGLPRARIEAMHSALVSIAAPSASPEAPSS